MKRVRIGRRAAVSVVAALAAASGVAEAAPGPVRARLAERIAERSLPKQAPDETKTLDGRTIAIWKTQYSVKTVKSPLILFSHGFGGCETQSSNLLKSFAESGYYVVAVRHQDARCGAASRALPEEKFGEPESWSAETYKDRRDDMRAVLAALKADPALKDKVNFDKIGLVGHSLGGYTVLALAGGWPEWKMEGVKAVVALSPYCTPFAASGTLAAVSNVQFQGGVRDIGVTPKVKAPGGCYDQTGKPAMYVEFEGAGHLAWTDVAGADQSMIETYAQSFLDSKLIGGTALTRKLPGVVEVKSK